jgi:hypothetical protein
MPSWNQPTPALCVVKCRFCDTRLRQRKRRLQAIFRAFANVLCRSLKTTHCQLLSRAAFYRYRRLSPPAAARICRPPPAARCRKNIEAHGGDAAPPTAAIRPQKFLRRFNPAFRRPSHALSTPSAVLRQPSARPPANPWYAAEHRRPSKANRSLPKSA